MAEGIGVKRGEQMFNALFYKGAKGGSPSNNTLQIFLLRCYFIKSNMILRDASASKNSDSVTVLTILTMLTMFIFSTM